MKKIAVIGLKGLPAYGGAASVGENIINKLKEEYDFTVYATSSHTHLKTEDYNGFKQIVFKKIPIKKLNTLYYYIISAFHSLFYNNYDLIHLHHRDATFIIPLLKMKYKVIVTTHGMILTKKWKMFSLFFKIQDRLFLGLANQITCVSLKDKEILSKLFRKKEINFIPNGIEPNFINRNKEKKFKICFAAGRILPDKGCHILLKALIDIKFKDPVVIIGDLDQIPKYKKMVKTLSALIPNIEIIGLLKEKNTLFDIIQSSEIFIYPSLIESMSLMLIEVASLQIPIICSDIKENRDLFSADEVLFFTPNDSKDLGAKINFSFRYNEIMKKNASNAFKKIIKEHQWCDISNKYRMVYKNSF